MAATSPISKLGWSCRMEPVNTDGQRPRPRQGHTLTFLTEQEQHQPPLALLVGGRGSSERGQRSRNVLADAFLLDLRSGNWKEVSTNSDTDTTGATEKMTPRWKHSAVCWRDSVIVFGGETSEGDRNAEVLAFRGDGSWSRLKTLGGNPTPRSGHTAVMVTPDDMVVFGGSIQQQVTSSSSKRQPSSPPYLDDVWRLHLPSLQWSQVSTGISKQQQRPSARNWHCAVPMLANEARGPGFLIFGGYAWDGKEHYFNDAWHFEFDGEDGGLASGSWKLMFPSSQRDVPAPRNRATLNWVVPSDGETNEKKPVLLLSGGNRFHYSGPLKGEDEFFNDAWICRIEGDQLISWHSVTMEPGCQPVAHHQMLEVPEEAAPGEGGSWLPHLRGAGDVELRLLSFGGEVHRKRSNQVYVHVYSKVDT